MKVLVTGLGGLLGHAVEKRLTQCNQIISIVKSPPLFASPTIHYIVCDLSDDFDFHLLPPQIDVILHLAQSPNYRDFPNQSEDVFKVNCNSTLRLLNYAIAASAKHFIFTSSGNVYEPYLGCLDEERALAPVSFYANSKLVAERLILSFKQYFKVSILRLFCLYGESLSLKQTLINNLIDRVEYGQEVFIDGASGGMMFTPTYTVDIAVIIDRIIEERLEGVFNVANPEVISIEHAVNSIASCLGKTALLSRYPNKTAVSIIPKVDKVLSYFNDFTFTPFKQGLVELLKARI